MRRAWSLALALLFACGSSEDAPGGAPSPNSTTPPAPATTTPPPTPTVTPPPPPPFDCTPASATSPVLAATMLFDPADPHPGDTLTVLVKSTNGFDQNTAPKMTLAATGARGTTSHDEMIRAGVLGTKGVVYHFEVPDVALGGVCLLASIGGKPELAGKIAVTPRPAPAPSPSGVYKVASNHQFTCAEEVPWGNEFHVAVLDANGKGVPAAVVEVHLPATTDTSHIKNADQHPVPATLTMDGNGQYDDYFWWPSDTNGYLVLELTVRGAASDVATEITSGWWETNASGCRYCDPANPINVYGHWSHRVVFQLDPSATQAWVVGSDHAGQSACGAPGHLYHDPSHAACWPAR